MVFNKHLQLHERALQIAGKYLQYEAQLISILQELDRDKTYQHFQMTSLCAYAVKYLRLSESVALTLIAIARKAVLVPALKAAIEEKKITVSNARRIAPILSPENKTEWLEKAAALPLAKLEQALAKSFPQEKAPTKIRYKSEANARLEVDLPLATIQKLKRAQEILSQRKKVHCKEADALEAILDEFIERHDPLVKAKRILEKTQTMNKLPVARPVRAMVPIKHLAHSKMRAPLPAAIKHQAVLRDQNQCTHTHSDGARCQNKQWLHIHHVREVARGGSNELSNLITLCSAHHRMEHRQ